MPTAKEFVTVALGQVGVTEYPANSNRTKYGEAFGANGEFWCAIFEWWCGDKAAKKYGGTNPIPHNANAAYGQDEIVSKKGGKWIMKKTKSANTRREALKKYKKGDIVDMDFGKMTAYREHTGIVVKVDGLYVVTVEGNTSVKGSQNNGGRVCKKWRYYKEICSCARPKFDAEPKAVPKTKLIAWNIGHSDTDAGAVSKYGKERDFCVAVSNYAVKYLRNNYNCKVIVNNTKATKKLEDFIKKANKEKADLYVSVHFNSGKGDGWEGLLYNLDEKHKKCGIIFEKHIKAIGQNSRGLKARPDLINLKMTNMMAILNECAFIDNWKDIKDWNEDKEFKKMGEALAKASAEYLKLKKKTKR